MPEAFVHVRPGEIIRLDDGKIEGVIRSVTSEEMRVEITLAKPGGTKLRTDKGINFPESRLRVAAVTDKDLADLDFVVQHADLVGMSFVNDPEDVLMLQEELQRRGGNRLGIMLKIETKRGFRQLPWLLLAAMRSYPVGVMIARGDLAVECGWERLAEVQEEILWLCEAAHVPVIWATQVLESLAKKGLPSRAEITDAAMAVRAECVMLNKGPYITRALTTLDHILRRMQEHQSKKTARLRNLTLAGDL
jgi:pyruvate kinase